MPNHGQNHNQKISAHQAELARRDFLQLLRRVFESPDGERALAWLHSTAATREPCFRGGEFEPNRAAYRDGRKSIIWEIEKNLDEARAAYGSETGEAAKPKATRKRKTAGNGSAGG